MTSKFNGTVDDTNTHKSCSICIERVSSHEPITSLPECHHTFHSKCFLEYIQYNIRHPQDTITCPICRRTVIDTKHPQPASSNMTTLEMIYIHDDPPTIPDQYVISLNQRRQMTVCHCLLLLACSSLLTYMWYLSIHYKIDDDATHPVKMPMP